MCYLLIVKTHYRRDHLQFQCYYFRYMINSLLSWIHISNTMYDAIHLYVHLLELVYYVISFRVLEHFVSSKWKKIQMKWTGKFIRLKYFGLLAPTHDMMVHTFPSIYEYVWECVSILHLMHFMRTILTFDNIEMAYQNETFSSRISYVIRTVFDLRVCRYTCLSTFESDRP